jgi:hypothetical protein
MSDFLWGMLVGGACTALGFWVAYLISRWGRLR